MLRQSVALSRRGALRLAARHAATQTREQPEFLSAEMVHDLNKVIKTRRKYDSTETFDLITERKLSRLNTQEKDEEPATTDYDPVTRAPYVKSVAHLQLLLDALLALKNFDRAMYILRAIYKNVKTTAEFVPSMNKYLQEYSSDPSATVRSLEEVAEQFQHRLQPQNDRTRAILLAKASENEEEFGERFQEILQSGALQRVLAHADVIPMGSLAKMFGLAEVQRHHVPADLVGLYDEVRSEKKPQYFEDDSAQAPVVQNEAAELFGVDSFGLKVVRHHLLGLELSTQQKFEEMIGQLGQAEHEHILYRKGLHRNKHDLYRLLNTDDERRRFNEILDVFNWDRQMSLEARGSEGARAMWEHEYREAKKRGDVALGKNLNAHLYKWYQDMLPLIRAEWELCRKLLQSALGKRAQPAEDKQRAHYAPFFVLVSPESLAVLTIFEMLRLNSLLGIVDGMKASRAVLAVGRNTECEYRTQRVLERGGKRPKTGDWRRRVARDRLDGPADDSLWGPQIHAKIGAVLCLMLLHVAKVQVFGKDPLTGEKVLAVQPAFFHKYEAHQGHTVGVFKLHRNLVRFLGGADVGNSASPTYLPMLVRPKPWTGPYDGGYLSLPTDLVRVRDSLEAVQYVKAAARAGNLDHLYRGLNVLGDTAWTMNKKVLDVITQCWNTGKEFLDIPPALGEPDLPEKLPPNAEPYEKHAQMVRIKALLNEAAAHRSLRCLINYKLEIARAYVGEKMYFPHNVDFRGRAYPLLPHLNHLGNDLTRALFLFWDAKPLGTEGLRWLKIHLANVFGLDKAPIAERVQFADDNMHKIFDSAENPLNGGRWWVNADKPWQALAVCFELHEAYQLDDPTQYKLCMPVHQDGTCNGLQHYAALGGDIEGARQVNLVPADRPQDVYKFVAGLVEEKLAVDAEKGVPLAKELVGKISRKVVKQTVMTNVYGVTYIGAVKQIDKQLHFLAAEDKRPYAAYLAKLVLEAVRDLFSGAHKIQDWLAELAKRISKSVRLDLDLIECENEKPNHTSTVIWTTPLGLPCVQPYRSNATKVVLTSLQNCTITDPFSTTQVDSRKQLAALPPNFVHSLDATHMLMTATACGDKNMAFAAVHDSYWTHACDVDEMNKAIRDEFVRLHENDTISQLKKEFETRYAGYLQVLRIPALHTFDIGKTILDIRKRMSRDLGRPVTLRDEAYLEKKRQELLRSDDPAKVAEGEALVTTVSVTHGHDLTGMASTQGTFVLVPLTFPELPKKGDLDIKCVEDSPYFFS